MSVATCEGSVDHGQIRPRLTCACQTKQIYIIVPGVQVEQSARIASPRLAHPEQAVDFEMEIVEEHQGR